MALNIASWIIAGLGGITLGLGIGGKNSGAAIAGAALVIFAFMMPSLL
jgi:hypothetical protein